MTISTNIYFKSTKITKGRNIGDNLNRTQKVKEDRCKSLKTQKRKRHTKTYKQELYSNRE